MKTLITCTVLFISLLALPAISQAESGGVLGGGGGSWDEAALAAEQENYHQVLSKIRNFFINNEKELDFVFTEFKVSQLLNALEDVRLEVVDRELEDDDKVKGRTCVFHKKIYLIECDIKKLQDIKYKPEVKFVMMLHEVLGLMDVEETTPKNMTILDGYKVSKKIAPYVTKVADYDLRLESKDAKEIYENWFDSENFLFGQLYIIEYEVVDSFGWYRNKILVSFSKDKKTCTIYDLGGMDLVEKMTTYCNISKEFIIIGRVIRKQICPNAPQQRQTTLSGNLYKFRILERVKFNARPYVTHYKLEDVELKNDRGLHTSISMVTPDYDVVRKLFSCPNAPKESTVF